MRKVAIVSWAVSQFSRDSSKNIFDLACEPSSAILKKHKDSRDEIDALLVSSCTSEQYSSSIISEMLGLRPEMSQRVDNLCNSGTNAVVSAYSLIASGICDLVLVTGAEKAESTGNRLVWDLTRGSFTYPVHWAALFASAHMRKYGTTEEQMAAVTVKNRAYGSRNPNALFRSQVTMEEVMSSRTVAPPLKLLDCSATCDGAASVLLASDEIVHRITDTPVWLLGIGQKTNSASFANATDDLTSVESARMAGRRAFEMAGMDVSDIDVAEVHDAFTILEIIALEDLGFAKPGTMPDCHAIINPRGGILGNGHPIGATGVAQVAEIASQLAGKAGNMQVPGCKHGLVHNLAAAGSSATVLIMGN